MVITHIDPQNALPKYRQLYLILLNKIEEGEWPAHNPIPPERELEEMYNISRTTVRQALSLMVSQGYLYREQGRGTFIAPPKLQYSLNLLRGFSESMKDRGIIPDQKIISINRNLPPYKVQQNLEITEEVNNIINIERIRIADGIPIGYQSTYVALRRGQSITQGELENCGSLYKLLRENFNLIPTEAIETVEATIADEHEANLLEIETGGPILLIERTVWSQFHRPMEFLKALYRGDKYKYFVKQTLS